MLGANDGILSTSSLIVGVAAAGQDKAAVLVTGLAGLAAGALSMAAGEYVSVSSQADAEAADLARERKELVELPQMEREELAQIYVGRGLTPDLAHQVADQMMAHDALAAHARDELGITDFAAARPLQAASASAAAFSAGALLPIAMALLTPQAYAAPAVAAGSIVGLILLGVLGARAGKAKIGRSVVRVVFWGLAAMAATAVLGRLIGAAL